jgi:glycosyltransferase involved in cell wall biosynthesis
MNSVAPLPIGFSIEFDPDTKDLDDSVLFGGSPARIMRISAAGRPALAELRAGSISTPAAGVLARKLTDANVAHPRPPARTAPLDVTVLIPVRDRARLLDRCLTALGRRYPVVIVDDASRDPQAVAEVVRAHGAILLSRPDNGGPGAARNTGLAFSTSEFVALLDSDCIPGPDWISGLAAHFADPLVAAVAPRIVAAAPAQSAPAQSGPARSGPAQSGPARSGPTQSAPTHPAQAHPGSAPKSLASRFTEANGSLDLGPREARVLASGRVSYVPTAALLVRRAALVSLGTAPFDESLRIGEDVDLIWRLHDADWRIRYDPSVEVGHQEPETWRALLARRFRYGTSAAPLAARHPEAMAPLALHPWPTLTVTALLGRRPAVAAVGFAGSVLSMRASLQRANIPARGVVPAMATASNQTWLGLGRYLTQFGSPFLLTALVKPGGLTRTRRWGRRGAAASLLLGPPLATWAKRRPQLDPTRFLLAQCADDISYGAGVWAGALREGTMLPLRPRLVWRPLRVDTLRNRVKSRRQPLAPLLARIRFYL